MARPTVNRDCAAAVGNNSVSDFLRAGPVNVQHGDGRALLGERARGDGADALRAAGDRDAAAFEFWIDSH